MAKLCGDAAAIAGLDICVPTTTDGQEEENSSNAVKNSTLVGYGAFISACNDGVLGIWIRNSIVGLEGKSPLGWKPLAWSTIACCGVDTVH